MLAQQTFPSSTLSRQSQHGKVERNETWIQCMNRAHSRGWSMRTDNSSHLASSLRLSQRKYNTETWNPHHVPARECVLTQTTRLPSGPLCILGLTLPQSAQLAEHCDKIKAEKQCWESLLSTHLCFLPHKRNWRIIWICHLPNSPQPGVQ